MIGTYTFKKWGERCNVDVFAMSVTQVLDQWPEDFMRRRIWSNFRDAAGQARRSELRALILNLPDRLPEFKKPSLIKHIDCVEGFIAKR